MFSKFCASVGVGVMGFLIVDNESKQFQLNRKKLQLTREEREENERKENESLNGLSTQELMEIMQTHNWTSPPANLSQDKLIKWYASTDCGLSPDGSHELCSLAECEKVSTILFQRLPTEFPINKED